MNETEQKIVDWLHHMADLVPGRGMAGHVAGVFWRKVAEGVERGDHHRHAVLFKPTAETVRQAGPARPEGSAP